jgi:hypothetical protein
VGVLVGGGGGVGGVGVGVGVGVGMGMGMGGGVGPLQGQKMWGAWRRDPLSSRFVMTIVK